MANLLDLKTDLRSLKFGHDRPGGGSSNEPYITTDINDIDSNLNKFRLTKFDSGFIRGGVVGAANASAVDLIRIGKFLTDAPQGPLFIAKQVALQSSNPRLEIPKSIRNIIQGTPDNILSSTTKGLLQPTRIYNLGVNTIAQIPVTAFGVHFNRHGILPVQNEASKYEAVVSANNKDHNRLVGLTNKFTLGDRKGTDPVLKITNRINNILGLANSISTIFGGPKIPSINLNNEQLIIDQYFGGPGSTFGLGNTTIRRYSNTEDGIKIQEAFENSSIFSGKTRNDRNEPVELDYIKGLGTGKNSISDYGAGDISIESENIKKGIDNYSTEYKNPKLKVYDDLRRQIEKQQLLKNPIKVFTSGSITGYVNQFGIYNSDNKSYSSEDVGFIGYKNGYDEIVKINFPNWSSVSRENRVGSGRQDQINLTPLFNESSYWYGDKTPNGDNNIRDLVKFAIQSVHTDNPSKSTFMIFRAYITQFSDNINAQWNDVKYAGRGNKFYIYDGFDRKIQIGFKVAALSAEEMAPMYAKLNYLMGNLMPDYSGVLMRGPLVRMTIGNYLDAQFGKLDSLTYNITQDTPWEIAIDEPEGGVKQLILPHVIEVSMTFTPIGAETQQNNLIEDKNRNTSFIAQNNTGADVKNIQYFDSFLKQNVYNKGKANQTNIEPQPLQPLPNTNNINDNGGVDMVSFNNNLV
jgi:hypothetical protein